jgi:hypothetical protein
MCWKASCGHDEKPADWQSETQGWHAEHGQSAAENETIFRVLAGRSSFVVLIIIIIIIINISHTPSLTDCHVRTTCRKFHWLLKPLA